MSEQALKIAGKNGAGELPSPLFCRLCCCFRCCLLLLRQGEGEEEAEEGSCRKRTPVDGDRRCNGKRKGRAEPEEGRKEKEKRKEEKKNRGGDQLLKKNRFFIYFFYNNTKNSQPHNILHTFH